MDCIKRFGVVVVLGIGLFSGCSKSESTGSTTTTSDGVTIQESDPNSSPMAKAAYEFLDAVLKGDTQRARRQVDAGRDAANRGERQAVCAAGTRNGFVQDRRSSFAVARSGHRAVCVDRHFGRHAAQRRDVLPATQS